MNTQAAFTDISDIVFSDGNTKYVCAEMSYSSQPETHSFCDVHSDICPPKHSKEGLLDADYREFLHTCLDEWLNKSEGTGCFMIGDTTRLASKDEDDEDWDE